MERLIILALVGLLAQFVDGSLGMGYGVTSASLLIAAGVAPAMASATVHLAQVGTTLASGIAHQRFGNVDWRIVSLLAVPGAIGAFAGAFFLVSLPADAARPWIGLILFSLGGYVLWRFLLLNGARPQFKGKLSAGFLAPLGLVAGTLDSVGGGGWGPVGTTSLLSTGKLEPRKVIGSVSAAEFVVTTSASVGFLIALGISGINFGWVLALLAGGVIAAPLAAWVVRHMTPRILGVAAGGLILVTNSKTMLESWAGLQTHDSALWWIIGAGALAWLLLIGRVVIQERTRRAPLRTLNDSEEDQVSEGPSVPEVGIVEAITGPSATARDHANR